MPTPFSFSTVGVSGYSGNSGYSGFSGAFTLGSSITATSVTVSGAFVRPTLGIQSSSAINIDFSVANTQAFTLSSNVSATLVNAIDGELVRVFITNPSTYTVTWAPSGIVWNSGVAPVQSTGSTNQPKTDKYIFEYIQGKYFATPFQTFYVPYNAPALVATGGTLTTGNGYNQWTFTSSGTWTVTNPGIAYYAIVAGGGGGGGSGGGGSGAGAGGVVTGILSASAGTYSVIIGAGGVGALYNTINPTNGNITSLAGLSAVGGGAGANVNTGSWAAPFSGGSGGGVGTTNTISSGAVGVAGQGWQGGGISTTGAPYPGGAGGGAGGIGGSGSGSQSGAGGIGVSIYLPASGVSTYVGGGGGGGGTYQGSSPGAGGLGGGGSGGTAPNGPGTSGTANTGGGGGGGSNASSGTNTSAGTGGSGVVYIWAPTANPAKTPYVNYLIVAGGGGGAVGGGGGGGGGGLLTGSTTVSSGVTYTVTIGSGGAGATTNANGSTGANSGLSATGVLALTALGGGGGGAGFNVNNTGNSGGAGGGGGASTATAVGGAGTTGQGYAGGTSAAINGSYSNGGGGGGYGVPGITAATGVGGTGGDGGTFGIANGTGLNWSNKFNGSNYLYTSNIPSMSVGTGNFTVECWFYSTAAFGNNGLFHISSTAGGVPSGSGGIAIGLQSSQINYYNNGTNTAVSYTTPINQWNHIAIVRSGSTGTLYLNGSSLTTVSDSTNYSTTYAAVGAYYSSSYLFPNGYISNFRVVVGTALYTGSTYTVPTNGLSAISGTQLLTCQSPAFVDSSSNGATITTTGTPVIASQNPFGISYAGGGGGGGWYTGSTVGNGGMGGGGGGGGYNTAGVGSTGGGNGTQSTTSTTGGNGGTNTGGGGGGTSYSSGTGGTGGSGIVVLSYPSSYPVAASTTGSPSLSTINGNYIYKFTSSGSITF